MGHIPSPKSSLGLGFPNIILATKKNASDKCLTIFRSKRAVFGPFSHKKLYQLRNNWGIRLYRIEVWCVKYLSQKKTQRYLSWIERNEFFKKSIARFPTLRHPSSKCNILTTIAPNQIRLELMEIRHLEISKDIK